MLTDKFKKLKEMASEVLSIDAKISRVTKLKETGRTVKTEKELNIKLVAVSGKYRKEILSTYEMIENDKPEHGQKRECRESADDQGVSDS